MLFFFFFSMTLSWAEDTKAVTVQLISPEIPSFQDWTLRLDTGGTYPFDDSGRLNVSIPQDSVSFEILDSIDTARFFGVWSSYEAEKEITIQVSGGFSIHEVVSASRIRQSSWNVAAEVAVVRPDEQKERSVSQTSDWLKEQAEVLVQKTNLGGGSPIMRGMSGNRVLLMVDGFRLNNAIFRLGVNQYMNTVPGSQLEQIEILNGPGGVQYGSDALGGTIHIRSADPASRDGSNLEYRGFVSSADGTNTHQISGHGGSGRLFLQGHYQYNKYHDLEAADPVGEQVPTGYNGWDSSLNLTYKMNEGRRLRLINTDSQAAHVPRTDRIQSGRDLLWEYHPQKLRLHGLRYESQTSSPFSDYLEVGFGLLRQDEGIRRRATASPDELTVDRTAVDTLQLNGTFTKITKRIHWVYGFDAQLDRLDTNATSTNLEQGFAQDITTKFPNDSEYRTYGLFGVADIILAKNRNLKLGLRQTRAGLEGTLAEPIGHVDESFSQLTPSLSWSLTGDRHFLSLGVSQGFRAPNLEDALALGPNNKGFDAPNPGLKPEESWNYEANIRWKTERSLWQASLYTSRYESLIERVPGAYNGSDTFEGEPVFILDNVGKAEVNGISLQYQMMIDEHNTLSADASWTRGTQTDRNEPMTRIPPLRGNISWAYHTAKWRLNGLFTWADRQDRLSPGDLDDNRIPEGGTPGYGVLNFRVRYELNDRFAVKMGFENLGDKLYKQHGSGIYDPGRRAVVELNAKWK